MRSYQFISGFSDLKVQFRTKTGTKKSLEELILWFSFEDSILYIHDYEDHEMSMAIAIYNSKTSKWIALPTKGSLGRRLVEHFVKLYPPLYIAERFNLQYELYGFRPFGI